MRSVERRGRCAGRRSRPASPRRSSRLRRSASTSPPSASPRAARQQHAREAGAAQAILVVHRRLVHEVGERAVGVGGAVAEEDQRARRAGSRSTRSRRATFTSSQSPPSAPAGRQHRVDDVERRQVDEAGVGAGRRAQLPRIRSMTSRRASVTMNSWPSAARSPGDVADLRAPRSGTAPSCAPASGRAGRGPARAPAPARTARATPSRPGRARPAPTRRGPAEPLEHARRAPPTTAARSRMLAAVSDGTSAPSGSGSTAWARRSPAGRRATRGGRRTPGWRRSRPRPPAPAASRSEEKQAHSTNVTLLISRSVVMPVHHPLDRRLAQEAHALPRAPPS